MIRLLAIVLVAAFPLQPRAQELKLGPVDEAEKDERLLAFRAALLDAVVARDVEAILSMTAEDIELSFGGGDGHAGLRAFLTVDPESFPEAQRFEAAALRERNWADLETALRMGGVFDGDGRFVAPYTYAFKLPGGMDPYDVMFVTGTGVALRDRAIRYGEVLAWLDHDVMRYIRWASGTSYVEVERADGLRGFVHRDYLRALVDYRAIIEKRDGVWKMTRFIAGD